MIFKLSNDFENTYSLLIDNIELLTKMPTFRPRFFATSREADWSAPQASLYASENFEGPAGAFPDLTTWGTGLVVFSPKAHAAYNNSLSGFGEFLPMTINAETWYLYNTLYIIPDAAIDKSRAVEVVDTGVHHGQSNVVFDESYLNKEGVMVFKTTTNKLMHSLCTDSFKKLYDEHGFKGLQFNPV
jgi:hypothetical protein